MSIKFHICFSKFSCKVSKYRTTKILPRFTMVNVNCFRKNGRDYFPDLKRTNARRWASLRLVKTLSLWFRWNCPRQCNGSLSELGFKTADSEKIQFENVWCQKHSRFEQICSGDSRQHFEKCCKPTAVKKRNTFLS